MILDWHGVASHIDWRDTKVKIALLATISILCIGIAAGGYYWLYRSRQLQAQAALSESLDGWNVVLMRLMQGQLNPAQAAEQWQELQVAFAHAYERNSASGLAPYMQLLQAQVTALAGQPEEAYQGMQKALPALTSSPYYQLYRLYAALLATSLSDHVTEGAQVLQELAQASNNPFRSLALVALGQYKIAQGDVAAALQDWHTVIDLAKKDATATDDRQQIVVAQARQLLVQYGSVADQQ